MKGLEKSKKHVKKGELCVGDCELGRERRKRRVKGKGGGKWMGCSGRQGKEVTEENPPRDSVVDNTKHWPRGK